MWRVLGKATCLDGACKQFFFLCPVVPFVCRHGMESHRDRVGTRITVGEGEDGQNEANAPETVLIRPINIPFLQTKGEKDHGSRSICRKTGFMIG